MASGNATSPRQGQPALDNRFPLVVLAANAVVSMDAQPPIEHVDLVLALLAARQRRTHRDKERRRQGHIGPLMLEKEKPRRSLF